MSLFHTFLPNGTLRNDVIHAAESAEGKTKHLCLGASKESFDTQESEPFPTLKSRVSPRHKTAALQLFSAKNQDLTTPP
jgi:hypothetical protein